MQKTRQRRPLGNPIGAIVFLLAVTTFAAVNAEEPQTTETPTGSEASQDAGTVQGTVYYHPDPKRKWRYQRFYVKNSKVGQLAEAVVVLTPEKRSREKSTHKPQTVTVDQKNFQFTPETTAIQAGDRVKFLNSDNQVHNVRSYHPFRSFNVSMPAGKEHVETFAKAGRIKRPYQIGCVYHSSMRAWIYVFDHPNFQVTKTDGQFELKNVPPGKYKLEMVHPAGELQWSQEIEVNAGKTETVDINVSPDDVNKKDS
ncbi:MAG: carboxypeptidase regulatory-like domain-containing protein [Planctomycetaceae bacterium]|nr:carboxypeptidase regulatory-like domain-containing protein [Planctomycetaceae bacterium]